MNIGVFGGTFDPPHVAHTRVAEHVRTSMGLDKVILVPCAIPPHKRERIITAGETRLEMLQLAVAGHNGLEISTAELDRGGVSYTVDTLEEFHRSMPDVSLFLLVGMDNMPDFRSWKDPQRILTLARVIVMTRPGFPADASVSGDTAHFSICEVPAIDIAASDIRRKAERGESIHGLVADSVEQYIQSHTLYR